MHRKRRSASGILASLSSGSCQYQAPVCAVEGKPTENDDYCVLFMLYDYYLFVIYVFMFVFCGSHSDIETPSGLFLKMPFLGWFQKESNMGSHTGWVGSWRQNVEKSPTFLIERSKANKSSPDLFFATQIVDPQTTLKKENQPIILSCNNLPFG